VSDLANVPKFLLHITKCKILFFRIMVQYLTDDKLHILQSPLRKLAGRPQWLRNRRFVGLKSDDMTNESDPSKIFNFIQRTPFEELMFNLL
jgi:hypothetical protein